MAMCWMDDLAALTSWCGISPAARWCSDNGRELPRCKRCVATVGGAVDVREGSHG